jgi:hypothetical protein
MKGGQTFDIGRRIRERPVGVKPENLILDKDLALICDLM